MSEQKIAKIWPEWKIEKQIGKGSFGTVYQCIREENNVESKAAIKVISIPLDSSEVDSLRSEGLDEEASKTYFKGVVDDFVNEIRMMESFKGIQNIVSVEDYKVVEKEGEIGWDIFIRMELLTPFNTYIQDKKLTEEDVIRLGCDICTALEICGQRNIIHRDIKPENIFVNDFGFFKLGDFGIARKMEHMTAGLSQKGTQNYMAPEVFAGANYDARVDIYSLGIVLYRLMNANRMPFIDSEQKLMNPNARREALDRRIKGEALPVPSEASEAMANVILRACAFAPQDRFTSAAEMKKALLAVQAGTYQPVVLGNSQAPKADVELDQDVDKTTAVRRAPEAKPVQPTAKEPANTFGKKKSKAPVIAAVILALLLILGLVGGGVVYFLNQDKEASKQEEEDVTPTEAPTPTPTVIAAPTETPTPEPVVMINMPNLYGYTMEDAEKLLSAASEDFEIVVEAEVYSEQPKGTVISQYPMADSDVLVDGTIKLTLSAGPAPTPTSTPTPVATNTPTPLPTSTPIPEVVDTPTPEPTATGAPEITNVPTVTDTPEPTATPTPTPELKATEGLEYKLHSLGTYYIVTGIGTAKGTEIIIPEEYNGKPVREIASSAFKNQSLVTKLVIPKTIKSIGNYAFDNMLSLTEVQFNAKECADTTYYGIFRCAGQESKGIKVTIGPEVTRIPAYLFYPYDGNAKNYANVISVTFAGTNVETIEQAAFYYCKNLQSIEIPEGVKTIGSSVFANCAGAEQLVISKTVKSIGNYAFDNMLSLTEVQFNAKECADATYYGIFRCAGQESEGIKVTIGSEVTKIPAYLFYPYDGNAKNYANVVSVTFDGTSVETIGQSAFYYCKNLKSVELPEGVKTIGSSVFANCAGAEQLVIPKTVKSIGNNAFDNMLSLTEVQFNAKECADVTYYGIFRCAGQESEGIKVTIGSEVTQIPAYLFYPYDGREGNFANIASVTFAGTNVKTIGKDAFYFCKKLPTITIPESVTTIGSYAFANCTSLTSAIFEEPYVWYSGNTIVEDFYDTDTAATALTSTYAKKELKKQ